MNATLITSDGLRCSALTGAACRETATKLRVANVDLFAKLATDPAARRAPHAPDPAAVAVEALRCNKHAAIDKRRKYGRSATLSYTEAQNRQFIPIDDPAGDALLRVARREYQRRMDAAEAYDAQMAAEADRRHATRTARRWFERATEPDYEVEYVEDRPVFADGRVDRSYSAYPAGMPAEQRRYNALLTVDVDDREQDAPAYIATRSSSNLTPKAARTLADMLIRAAALAEATTAERKAAMSD
jgi:hypothetical protein